RSLSQILSSGPLPVLTAVRLGRQMARALGAAHKAGIIHRDLKPANIMVTSKNQVKILDFGLARAVERVGAMATLPDVTTSGMVLGTAAYLAPEQVKGGHADVRSDIWALGCVLYQMLTGRRPFPGDTIPEILASVLRDEPKAITGLNPGVPSPLVALVAKCLSKEPNLRPQSAFEISSSLKDIFHQIRPGAAAPATVSSESIAASGAVHANFRNIENANRYLKMIDPSFPQFSMKGTAPSAVEIHYHGVKVGILFCTKQRDGGDVLAFVCPLFAVPGTNRPAFLKRLLSLSNGHTDVAQFSIDSAAGMVNVACFRACDSMDPIHFQHTLDVMSETVSGLGQSLRKEFGIP
ncbi:MAG TPA: protein kinase, partial [Acidobacteriota bacterium]|nr:protein kinase [Acidobacteriota bacterium]